MAICFPIVPIFLLLVCLSPASAASSQAPAASPPANAGSFGVGINYGRVADNLPPPASAVPLLRSVGASRVRLYDADPAVLRALAGSGVELTVCIPDNLLPRLARDPSAALAWIRSSLSPHLPGANITTILAGNEVLTGKDTALIQSLLPAMTSLHGALVSLGLDRRIAVTTAHSLAVLAVSYPPSASSFRRDLLPYVSPLLVFLAKTGSPFLINAYPYFAYKANPKTADLDYVLFEPNPGVVDPGTGLKYENMLHAQVDAVRAAVAKVAAGKGGVEVRVGETGWPSAGEEGETGATADNAARYNGNLIRMVAEGKGTPMAPAEPLQVYVFALFNENLKPGPASERHYGLFKPDGTPAYELGVVAAGRNDTAAAGAESPSNGSAAATGATSASSYYTFSSATKLGAFCAEGMSALVVATALGLVFRS